MKILIYILTRVKKLIILVNASAFLKYNNIFALHVHAFCRNTEEKCKNQN